MLQARAGRFRLDYLALAPTIFQIRLKVSPGYSNRASPRSDSMTRELAGVHQLVDERRTDAKSGRDLSNRKQLRLLVGVAHIVVICETAAGPVSWNRGRWHAINLRPPCRMRNYAGSSGAAEEVA